MNKVNQPDSAQTSSVKTKAPEPSPRRVLMARLQLLLLFAVFSAPMLGAYYFYVNRDNLDLGKVNHGELYQKPQDLQDMPLLLDGSSLSFNQLEKKWYLLVVADGACDEVCEKNLLTVRQIRRMQGKNVNRVVSALVYRNLDEARASDLSAKYSIAAMQATNDQQFESWLKPFYEARGESQFDASRIYIADPLKKLMMSYPKDIEPKLFFKDLKRLLKVSQIG